MRKMLEKIPKWTRIVIAVLIVAATFAAIIPFMTAGPDSISVQLNLPPVGQENKVVEVFNWQGAYGKPWDYEAIDDAHLGDLVAEWWGPGAFGVKFWIELDKCVVLYNWDSVTGEYDLIGMLCTLCDPRDANGDEPYHMDVWESSLIPGGGDGSYSIGCFTWLGAEEAQKVVCTLAIWAAGYDSDDLAWADGANPPNEDKVKAVISDNDYWKDRADKPHIFDGSELDGKPDIPDICKK